MHEFPLIQKIVRICIGTAIRNRATKITHIQLELGDFSFVVERLLLEGFKIATKGTIAENSDIIMKRTPGKIKCQDCGKISEIWFENAWKSGNENEKNKINHVKENLTAEDAMTGNIGFGANLFQCTYCKSKNTDLIDGKKILIKNIKVF